VKVSELKEILAGVDPELEIAISLDDYKCYGIDRSSIEKHLLDGLFLIDGIKHYDVVDSENVKEMEELEFELEDVFVLHI
jgi:hypothetical protein